MWLILSFVPVLLETTLAIMRVFAPDITLILLVCGAAVGLTALSRVVVYLAFTRRAVPVPAG